MCRQQPYCDMRVMDSGGDEIRPWPGSQPPPVPVKPLPLGGFLAPREHIAVVPSRDAPPGPSPLLAAAAVTSEDGGIELHELARKAPGSGTAGWRSSSTWAWTEVTGPPAPPHSIQAPSLGARRPLTPGALESSRKTLGAAP